MIECMTITSEESWLEKRHEVITSTEVAALYGLSPYMTRLELFYNKTETMKKIEATERMQWGNRLEPVIAQAVAEKEGWAIKKSDVFVWDGEQKIGASFDYFTEDGRILEIKNVSDIAFRKWMNTDKEISPPFHIMLQVQTQLMFGLADKAVIGVLVGGNTLHVIHVKKDEEIQNDIVRKVAEFWDDVKNENPPSIDWEADLTFVKKRLDSVEPDGTVMTANQEINTLLSEYSFIMTQKEKIDKEVEKIKTKLMLFAGESSKVIGTSHIISMSMVQPTIGKMVTNDMVGTYVGARKGYKTMRITEVKK